MPSEAAITRPSGVVRKPRTRSAVAPTYAVVTVMAAFSLRGYWRTFSERIACTPAITIRRLTTSATTGRRMKRSVNFMRGPFPGSLVHRLRADLSLRGQLVPHHHRRAVAQLEGAAAHDRLSRGQAAYHRDQVSAALAQADELLVGDQGRIAGRVALFLQREDRVAVRRVEHGGGWDHQHQALLRREQLHVGEHARAQASVRVRDG